MCNLRMENDVFNFGIPIEEGMIEWLMSLMQINELHCGLDERLKAKEIKICH